MPTCLSSIRILSLDRPARRGFSFTEILFAVMILGIGFIMIAAIFPVALQQTETSQAETVGAGLLIFTLSMDEIAVTFFLIGSENTLPQEIWGRLRRGITPEINAVSTLIFAVSVALIVVWYRVRTRGLGADAQELLERP